MKIAFMFPGQGAQFVGMGKDVYEKYASAKNVFDKASKILDIDMCKLCFEGIKVSYKNLENMEENVLDKTENTQIAIAVTSLAILQVLRDNGIEADVSVGLSLGEYVALIYSGYISFEEGLKLLQKRGYLMGTKVQNGNYAMSAIIGLDSKKIEDICNKLRQDGKFVVPANYNYSNQTVISGDETAIEEAMNILKSEGAKRVIKLNTSGPFHTEKLNEAKELYKAELEKVNFASGNVKVIRNLDGEYYSASDDMVNILANHIVSPVRFDKIMKKMQEAGIDTFYEIGPGKALSGFVKKEISGANVVSVSDVQSIECLINNI